MKKWNKMVALAMITAMLLGAVGCSSPAQASMPDKSIPQVEASTSAEVETASDEADMPEMIEVVEAVGEKPQAEVLAETADTELPLVSSQMNKTVTFEDGKNRYKIPKINLACEEAQDLNQEIYDTFYPYYKEAKKSKSSGNPSYEVTCSKVDYTWSVYDDILTILVKASMYPYGSGYTDYTVYNFNLETEEKATLSDICSKVGISKSTYRSRVKKAIGNRFCRKYKEPVKSKKVDDFTLEQFEMTVSAKNVKACSPYFDEDGNLWVRAWIYALAGGDRYPERVKVTDYKTSTYYDKMIDKVANGFEATATLVEPKAYKGSPYTVIGDSKNPYLETFRIDCNFSRDLSKIEYYSIDNPDAILDKKLKQKDLTLIKSRSFATFEAYYLRYEVPEVIPNLLMRFILSDGTAHDFYVTYNGRDGGATLIKIKTKK